MSTKDEARSLRPGALITLSLLGVGLVGSLVGRPLPEARAAAPAEPETAPTAEPPGDAEAELEPATRVADEGQEAAEPTAEPLRVVGLGWELLAPGILANDGLAPGSESRFDAAGLRVELSVAASGEEVEARLARGGGVEGGADVALVPLPTFVASYEHMRALSPEVFFVVGWSEGRDALYSEREDLLTGAGAKLRGEIELVGEPGRAATMLGLFALERAGVDPRRIELIPPGSKRADEATARAIERGLPKLSASGGRAHLDARDLVLTSADAPGLIPIVAVAPAGFVAGHTDELARFGRVWLRGAESFAADVPAAARRVAEEPDGPEAVALLETMGYLGLADLEDGARLAGLSGRGAVSIETLFRRDWELWREVGVLSTPAPEHAPLDNSVIARVALGERGLITTVEEAPARGGTHLVLVHTLPDFDAERDAAAMVEELGLLAGAFTRGELELRVRRDKRASARIIAEAVERYGLDPEHLRVGPRIRGREAGAVVVRVLVP
jgi:hypothetical protein